MLPFAYVSVGQIEIQLLLAKKEPLGQLKQLVFAEPKHVKQGDEQTTLQLSLPETKRVVELAHSR